MSVMGQVHVFKAFYTFPSYRLMPNDASDMKCWNQDIT